MAAAVYRAGVEAGRLDCMVPAWSSFAESLGWRLTSVSEAHMFGWSFASFKRALGEPATFEAKVNPWVHGYARDRLVIVRPMYFHPQLADSAFLRAMSGTQENPTPPPLHTIAMAEIDPPIFAGLQLVTRPSGRFGAPRIFGQMPIARSDLAGQLWATAHDAMRVNALFSLGVPERLLRPALRRGAGIALHDGVAEIFCMGIPSPPLLRELVDWAAELGAQLSMLSNALPLRMADWPLSDAWARAAGARGLSFDAKRWLIEGTIDDVVLEARLETGHGALATSVRATLRSPLGCGLSIRRALETERPFFGKGPGNVFMGRAFDADFVTFAVDPNAARDRLSRSGVEDALVALGSGATQVIVDDTHLFVTDDGCSDGARLATRIDAALAAVAALSPTLRGGAYR
jgi:hypothetical protein